MPTHLDAPFTFPANRAHTSSMYENKVVHNPRSLYNLHGSICITHVKPMPKSMKLPCRMTGAQYLPELYVMLLEALYTVIMEMKQSERNTIHRTISPCISPFSLKFFLLQLFMWIYIELFVCCVYDSVSANYRFLTSSLNCSPLSSIFLNRSKLAQHGLSRTVYPGLASLLHASMHSFML